MCLHKISKTNMALSSSENLKLLLIKTLAKRTKQDICNTTFPNRLVHIQLSKDGSIRANLNMISRSKEGRCFVIFFSIGAKDSFIDISSQ
jgi:hypothetical protein